MSPHLLLLSLFLHLLPLVAPSSTPPHTLPQHILLPSIRATGQTLESCQSTADCQPPRECLTTEDFTPCSTPPCICIPTISLLPCSTSDDCETGEVCAAGIPGISFNCVSDAVVDETPELRQVNGLTDPPLPGGGFTLDQCRTDLQCTDSRVCVLPDPARVEPCRPNSPSCLCAPSSGLETCETSAQCVDEEVCVEEVIQGGAVCVSEVVNDAMTEQFPQVDEGTDTDDDAAGDGEDPADQGSEEDPGAGDDGSSGSGGEDTAPDTGGDSGPGTGGDSDSEADDDGDDDAGSAPPSGPNPGGNDSDDDGSQGGANSSQSSPSPSSAPAAQGLSFEPCESGEDCLGLRGCFTSEGDRCIDVPDATCGCTPLTGPVFCGNADHCPDGEVCVEGTLMGFELRGVCASPVLAATVDSVIVIEEEDGRGVSSAACFNDGGCLGERSCVLPSLEEDALIPCPPIGGLCICALPDGPKPCESSAECAELELCLIGVGAGGPVCIFDEFLEQPGVFEIGLDEEDSSPVPETISPEASSDEMMGDGSSSESPGVSPEDDLNTPVPGDDDPVESPEVAATPAASPSPSVTPVPFICVDARLLEGMKKEELVFEEHAVTTVLCDKMGSCATPGHIVVWNDTSMMMRSYCALAGGCEEVQMEVNSPRWRRQLRVATKTSGLEFTAFAAKYATRGEEMALTTLVRVGL